MEYIKYNYNEILQKLEQKNNNIIINFKCFQVLKEYIDIQGYYEIIRLCDLKTLQNILNKIDTQWKHIQKTINSKKYNTYTLNCSCNTYVEFDDNLIEFINNNKVIAIMCINIICSYCINL